MELSKALRDHSKTIKGKQQLIMSSYAKALEIIPRQLVRMMEEKEDGDAEQWIFIFCRRG